MVSGFNQTFTDHARLRRRKPEPPGRWSAWLDVDVCHHAAVLMLEDVAVIHESARDAITIGKRQTSKPKVLYPGYAEAVDWCQDELRVETGTDERRGRRWRFRKRRTPSTTEYLRIARLF